MLPIFVSSTFLDLEEHRSSVREIIRQIGAVDIAMEHLGARDERPKNECLRLINEESKAFIGIYAHRYGHIPKGDACSITEAEYNAASVVGLKRFIYVVDENIPWQKKLIDQGKKAQLLDKFKKKLLANHVCKPFKNKDGLSASVAADIAREFAFSVYPKVGSRAATGHNPSSIKEWTDVRAGVYRENRNVFLAHTIRPSRKVGQLYDIAIYLIPHRSNDPKYLRTNLSDIVEAEFFLGAYFDNKVFRIKNRGGVIGITTSAYGPFLCTCRVSFIDGGQLMLNRYIDFEMGSLIESPNPAVHRIANKARYR
jgi:hypothetical protein